MMKTIKTFLYRLFLTCCMAGSVWVLSLLSPTVFDILTMIACVLCVIILVIGGSALYLKRLRHLWMILLIICFPAFAQVGDSCAQQCKISTTDCHLCVYTSLTNTEGSSLCNYMRDFNPTRDMNARQLEGHHRYVDTADTLVDAYQNLVAAAGEEGGNPYAADANCHVVDSTDGQSVNQRREQLRQNNTPYCCAQALQTLDQIYTSLHTERKVETVPAMLADEKMQCWACDVVYLLIVLANTMANRTAPAVARIGIEFLAWAFAFWLALKVGMLLLNRNFDGKGYDAPQFFKEFLTRLLLVGLVALILTPTANNFNENSGTYADLRRNRPATLLDETYSDVIDPIFNLVAGVGIEISQTLMGNQNLYQNLLNRVRTAPAAISVYAEPMSRVDYCTNPNAIPQSAIYQNLNRSHTFNPNVSGLIGPDLARTLLCITQLPTRGVSPISAAGSVIASYGITNPHRLKLLGLITIARIPRILYLFYGYILILACWCLGFKIACRLINIIVRMAIVVILFPLVLALAVFPLTRPYAQKALNFFLNALMGTVELAVATGLIVPFFYRAIADSGNQNALLNAMVAPFNSQYVPNLYEQFTQRGFALVVYLLGVAWLSTHLLNAASAFFTKFGFGGVTGQKSGATMGAAFVDVRQMGGDAFDFAKGVKKRAGAFTKGRTGSNGGTTNASAPSANRRAWEDFKKNTKVGRGITAANKFVTDNKVTRGYKAAKNKAHQGAQAVKNFAKNNKVTRAAKAVGEFARNNKVTRAVSAAKNKVAKGAQAVKNFAKNNKVTRAAKAVGEFARNNKVTRAVSAAKNKVAKGAQAVKNFAKNNKVTRAAKAVGEFARNNKVTRGVRRVKNAVSDFAKNNKVTRAAKAVGEFARNNKVTRGVRRVKNAVSDFAKNNMAMRALGRTIMFARDNKVVRGVRIIRGAMEEAGESGIGRAAKSVKDFAVDQAKKGTHQFFHPEE